MKTICSPYIIVWAPLITSRSLLFVLKTLQSGCPTSTWLRSTNKIKEEAVLEHTQTHNKRLKSVTDIRSHIDLSNFLCIGPKIYGNISRLNLSAWTVPVLDELGRRGTKRDSGFLREWDRERYQPKTENIAHGADCKEARVPGSVCLWWGGCSTTPEPLFRLNKWSLELFLS